MIETPSQAKRFFSDRIIHQAGVEKVPLSKAERKMLFWSESDSELDGSAALDSAATLSTEMSDDEYESIMVANAIGSKLRWWPQVWGWRAVPAALGVIAMRAKTILPFPPVQP